MRRVYDANWRRVVQRREKAGEWRVVLCRERERKGGKIKRLVLNGTRKGIFVHSFSAPAEQVIFSLSHRNNGPWA